MTSKSWATRLRMGLEAFQAQTRSLRKPTCKVVSCTRLYKNATCYAPPNQFSTFSGEKLTYLHVSLNVHMG